MENQLFTFGEVYAIDDRKIRFVPREEAHIPEDKERFVVVVQNDRENQDEHYPILTVAPITKRLDGRTRQCMEVAAGEAGLTVNSLIKAGLLQPIAKADLIRYKGKLRPEAIRKLYGLIYLNLGFQEARRTNAEADAT